MALASCGFTPVHGPGSNVTALRGQIMIQAPTNRTEYEFVKSIQRQIGVNNTGQYRLSYKISTQEKNTVVSADQDVNRLIIEGNVAFSLLDNHSDILSGRTHSFTAYSATGSTLATDQSRRNAQDRLMVILANQVMAEITSGMMQ